MNLENEFSYKISEVMINSIKAVDFITGRKIVWIEENEAKNFWVKGLNPCEYIAQYLKYFSIKCVNEIFNYNDYVFI